MKRRRLRARAPQGLLRADLAAEVSGSHLLRALCLGSVAFRSKARERDGGVTVDGSDALE